MSNDMQPKQRGRPRKHSNDDVTRSTTYASDVNTLLKETSRRTGVPINTLVNAIVRGYYIQRAGLPNMPPEPDPYSDALYVPIVPMYELSE